MKFDFLMQRYDQLFILPNNHLIPLISLYSIKILIQYACCQTAQPILWPEPTKG
jgi:hypothetical protein